MVCVSKTKTGLPTNIWLESVGAYKLNREGIIYIQNNYDDIQMILKYILDNVKIFLKHWNGDIDDQDVLNLLYSHRVT